MGNREGGFRMVKALKYKNTYQYHFHLKAKQFKFQTSKLSCNIITYMSIY